MGDPKTPAEALSYWLKIKGVTAYQVSKETLLAQSRLSEILAGRRRISPQTATSLGAYFDNGAEYWISLQARHDINESEKSGAMPSTCGGRLAVGGWELRCYVLPDDKRIVAARDLFEMLGINSFQVGVNRLASLIDSPFLKSKKMDQVRRSIANPIKLIDPTGVAVYGYEGDVIIDFCKAVMEVRRVGGLAEWAKPYAEAAEIFIISVAKVGIVALIDEATGNQNRRHKDALQRLLDSYFRQEYAEWTKRFPDWFYEELFRLKHWRWDALSTKRPPVVGKVTKDIVYSRLEPGALKELERLNPIRENGRRKVKHHQWLSQEVGHPSLDAHFYAIRGLMRAHHDWPAFYHMLQLMFPRRNEDVQLELTDFNPTSPNP